MEPIKKIPARYVGTHSVILQGGAVDPQGNRVGRILNYGTVILMPEREVRGQTFLRSNDQFFDLGTGKVIRQEDQGKSEEELAMLGYEFHQGRTDFEPVEGEQQNVPEPPFVPAQVDLISPSLPQPAAFITPPPVQPGEVE